MNHKRIIAAGLAAALLGSSAGAAAEPIIPMLKASMSWGGSDKATEKPSLSLAAVYESRVLDKNFPSVAELSFVRNDLSPVKFSLLGNRIDAVILKSNADEGAGMSGAAKAAIIGGSVVAGLLGVSALLGNSIEKGAPQSESGGSCEADVNVFPPTTNTNNDCSD